ncbi:MAG TPA: hypothetical protein VF621_05540 [Pyrinomonadaceae bacterium]|jgi:hypothetical protein
MDVATLIFVGFLCLAALFITVTVRRELIAKERRHREDRRESQHPRRKP